MTDYIFGEKDNNFYSGTWEEVENWGCERFADWQDKETPREFDKYWLNGEVLVVRVIDGRMVYEVR